MPEQAIQQSGSFTGEIDRKFALVCEDVKNLVPAKAACRNRGLSYNTFNKRMGKKAVESLRHEKGTDATTASSAPKTSPTPEGSDDAVLTTVYPEPSPTQTKKRKEA